jgi:hypothetical protein
VSTREWIFTAYCHGRTEKCSIYEIDIALGAQVFQGTAFHDAKRIAQ